MVAADLERIKGYKKALGKQSHPKAFFVPLEGSLLKRAHRSTLGLSGPGLPQKNSHNVLCRTKGLR